MYFDFMPITISIYLRCLKSCFSLSLLCIIPSLLSAAPPSNNHVPADSFLVLSVNAEALVSKSKILESSTWTPLVEKLALSQPTLHEILLDRNSSGLQLHRKSRRNSDSSFSQAYQCSPQRPVEKGIWGEEIKKMNSDDP